LNTPRLVKAFPFSTKAAKRIFSVQSGNYHCAHAMFTLGPIRLFYFNASSIRSNVPYSKEMCMVDHLCTFLTDLRAQRKYFITFALIEMTQLTKQEVGMKNR
jgi:hypothetical protein